MAQTHLSPLSIRRRFVNVATKHVVSAGGVSVVLAIVLLMGYLFWVVLPIFTPASINQLHESDAIPVDVLQVTTDDSFESLVLIRSNGLVEFRDTEDFELLQSTPFSSNPVQSVSKVYPTSDTFAYLTSTNTLGFFRISHQVRFIENERRLVQSVERLFNQYEVDLGLSPTSLDVFRKDEILKIASYTTDGNLRITEYSDADDIIELEYPEHKTFSVRENLTHVYFGPQGRRILLLDTMRNLYELHDIRRTGRNSLLTQSNLATEGHNITYHAMLLGRYSLLVGDASGTLQQWTLTTTADGTSLIPVRTMHFDNSVEYIAPELRRKGFLVVDSDRKGYLTYTTSNRILTEYVFDVDPDFLVFSPRGDRLVALANQSIATYKVENPHPEISWRTLWGKIWYEGYEEPVYSWQSSAADTDFEAKFSLTPLLFGTLKAAFYAMLFAVPLAVMGAIYTANFMDPRMRAWVKPSVEIMAALPTVIIGFIAGLWFAPILESHLTSILLCILVIPLGMLVFSALWSRLPSRLTNTFGGWYGAISAPIIVLIAWLTISFDEELSLVLFGGDLKTLLYEVVGLEYDQRNALVIGIAMGLAVIPTIFSIAEDAIYGVPPHLVHGSLALGATRWQTLVRVVLLTASPGIFSAIMIGFGRAVGETMIVLMATGNTPVMDINLFQGMRTFAANIAVEMPESEVDSTHFRILFLTALVLFLITFVFNTLAEVVRHRLRARYGNL